MACALYLIGQANQKKAALEGVVLKLKQKAKQDEQNQDNELVRMNKSLVLEIRAHTEAETRLKESEEKYKNLVNSLPQGIFIVQEGKIVFFNPGLELLTQYDGEKLFGMDPDLLFVQNKDLEPDPDGYEFIRAKDNSKICVEKQWVQIAYKEKPAQLFTLRDITERLKARTDKTRLESELEKAKKMEALGLLAGGVAHDLNNVLSGIVSTPELLLMDLPRDSQLREPLLTIKDSGKRASVIVDELLTLGRGSAKVVEAVNLNSVIQTYLRSPECQKSREFHPRVEVETLLDPDIPLLSASGNHLHKVVMNLVGNAMEAIQGSGQIFLSTTFCCLSQKMLKGYKNYLDGEFVRMRVEDTGPGIPNADLDRIFEPFYTKKILGRSGTGLGLSIVWNIVHDHKGYIHVTSRKEKTRFDLYFPVTQDLPGASKPYRIYTLSDYTGNNEIILVVDDSNDQLKITSNMLCRMGYQVVTKASGEAAVEYLTDARVDLVVLDMIMTPGMDGLATFRELRSLDPEIRAVIASGYSKTDDVIQIQNLGAGPFIKKPFSLQTLGLAVKAELEKRKDKGIKK
ncbi:MAG: response regulator [Desulfobacter sp.]|nr:MAG: response regulator [Desulfobacter sp.]